MSVQEQINTLMKDAMKSKNARELGVLRMVKTRFQVKLTEKGGTDKLTDEQAVEEISAYCKQQLKALPDYERAGERGLDKVEQIKFEVGYLEQFLPKLLDEAATEAIVDAIIAEQGLAGANQVGRLMGAVMAKYKGQVDAALVKQLASKKLGG
jgi:uncharacterized protein YqeY